MLSRAGKQIKTTYTWVEIDSLGILYNYIFFKAIFFHLADTILRPLLFPRALGRRDTNKNQVNTNVKKYIYIKVWILNTEEISMAI